MKRLPKDLLVRMGQQLAHEDREEVAIPSYLHPNPVMRWMAWRRLEVIADRLKHVLGTRPTARVVVDFGCGTGVLLPEMRSLADQVYGVDPVLGGARFLLDEWKLDGVTLLHPDAAQEAIPRGGVDAIVAAEVLEHFERLDETLSFLKALLKPDGRLLVSLPTENALYRLGRRLAGFHGHYHHSNARIIDAQIRHFGFKRSWREQIPAPGPLCIYWALEYHLP